MKNRNVNTRSASLWTVAILAMFSLTGCAMYPSKPGHWPGGVWGDILQAVSATIDFFARHLWGNYGIALLFVTVLVRLLILPLMVRQIRYSKMMQQMQPELAKVKEKHKGDSQKIQEETMKLWKEHGVNPMSGCLPTVIQLPVLYALFGAIEGNIDLNRYTFLWIFHMGQPDHYFILPIIAAITTYFSSRVMMAGNDSQTKMMLYIMPLSVLLIGSRFASGLALYWIYGNIFTTVQTYFIKVRPARADAGAATGTSGKAVIADKGGKGQAKLAAVSQSKKADKARDQQSESGSDSAGGADDPKRTGKSPRKGSSK